MIKFKRNKDAKRYSGEADNMTEEKENFHKDIETIGGETEEEEEEPSGNVRTKDMDTWVLGNRNPDRLALRQGAGSWRGVYVCNFPGNVNYSQRWEPLG